MEKLKYFVNNEFKDSKAEVWYDLHNPSTGEVTGQAPCCTEDEVLEAVEAAKAAYPEWKNTPARKRAAVLYNVRNLLNEHLDELKIGRASCRERV